MKTRKKIFRIYKRIFKKSQKIIKKRVKYKLLKRRDWDLNPGGGYSTGFQVLRLTRLDYLGNEK